MKRTSKGFTLVELLVTVVLLGIVATIVVINMTGISKQGQDREYEAFRQAVLSAATAYSASNSDVFANLYIDKAYMYITTGDVIGAGFLDENLVNPIKREKIGKDEKIKAVLDTSSGALKFEYPAENSETEQFLVALDDYVINGEPYDCMNGIGSYKLALSDENGNMITDVSKLLNEYGFTCEYDSSWQTWDDNKWYQNHGQYVVKGTNAIGDKDGNIKYTNEAGSYQVTYKFISDSGFAKEFKRTVNVLEKFEPGIELKTVTAPSQGNGAKPNVTNNQYDSGNKYEQIESSNEDGVIYKLFTPQVAADCNTWTFLAFKPTLTGADTAKSTYTIMRNTAGTGNYQVKAPGGVQNLYSGNDFNKIYAADDGEVTYTITTTTTGHYFGNYKLTTTNKITTKQDIIVPSCKVTGQNTTYDTTKTFGINDTYSPVGIKYYEYAVPNDPGRAASPQSNHLIARAGANTPYTYTLLTGDTTGSCAFNELTYEKIYFRAINNEGYYGTWQPMNLYATNDLYKLLNANYGGSCTNSCQPGGNSGTYGALNCHYCNKVKYMKYNGTLFSIAGRTAKEVVVADDSALISLSGTSVTRVGYWGTQTCDGYFDTNFYYSSPVFTQLLKGAADVGDKFLTCGSDRYGQVFLNYNNVSGNQGRYAGFSAIPSSTDSYLFGNVLNGGYWLSESGATNNFTICVHGAWCTTKSNYYFKAKNDQGVVVTYTGSTRPLKTMHLVQRGIVCSGNGSAGSPYVISKNC
ncbi:MAG: prepilin-type N-terminal cleavage/methylation domain-containing protein [Bacilli bacterium]|nr:prepilin-type N-terminal cleavage/methylation domain-containing protein [Bacilli bacterium]